LSGVERKGPAERQLRVPTDEQDTLPPNAEGEAEAQNPRGSKRLSNRWKRLSQRRKTMIDILSDEMNKELELEGEVTSDDMPFAERGRSRLNQEKSRNVEAGGGVSGVGDKDPFVERLERRRSYSSVKNSEDGESELKLMVNDQGASEDKDEEEDGEEGDEEEGSYGYDSDNVDIDEKLKEEELREYGLLYESVDFDDNLDFTQDEHDERDIEMYRQRTTKSHAKKNGKKKDLNISGKLNTRLMLYGSSDGRKGGEGNSGGGFSVIEEEMVCHRRI
jgi:hypothetical protein